MDFPCHFTTQWQYRTGSMCQLGKLFAVWSTAHKAKLNSLRQRSAQHYTSCEPLPRVVTGAVSVLSAWPAACYTKCTTLHLEHAAMQPQWPRRSHRWVASELRWPEPWDGPGRCQTAPPGMETVASVPTSGSLQCTEATVRLSTAQAKAEDGKSEPWLWSELSSFTPQ